MNFILHQAQLQNVIFHIDCCIFFGIFQFHISFRIFFFVAIESDLNFNFTGVAQEATNQNEHSVIACTKTMAKAHTHKKHSDNKTIGNIFLFHLLCSCCYCCHKVDDLFEEQGSKDTVKKLREKVVNRHGCEWCPKESTNQNKKN